ncbi:MAG: hypothetical protein L0Y72_13735 [Gemmataceae bacterium]|nr:hypothetical protein [Gemmataceae bacterium]MCI0740102.1 hypothetical protein [Gemmataceae bacterium]
MRIELHCPECSCRFVAAPQATWEELRAQMWEQGPTFALGDGATFEDIIFNTLAERGAIRCPQCGDPVAVNEESLGQLALEMLAAF